MAEGWPIEELSYRAKLARYVPDVLLALDHSECTDYHDVVLNVGMFGIDLDYRHSLPSVLQAAVELASYYGIRLIFDSAVKK